MDYAKYNRSLLDILQRLSTIPDLKDVLEEMNEYVSMGEMTYKSNPSTNFIYKHSGPILARHSGRIFARDMSLLTAKGAEWPEMFSSWIPKFASIPKTDQDYIWGKLCDSLTAIGHRPPPPPPTPTPTPTPTPLPQKEAISALPPPAPTPTPAASVSKVVKKQKEVSREEFLKSKSAAAAHDQKLQQQLRERQELIRQKQQQGAPQREPAGLRAGGLSDDERKQMHLKSVLKENPEIRDTVRAVSRCIRAKAVETKDHPGPEFDTLMKQLKQLSVNDPHQPQQAMPDRQGSSSKKQHEEDGGLVGDAEGFLQKNSGLFAELTGLLQQMADDTPPTEEEAQAAAAAASADELPEDEAVRKSMQTLSMVQQFHVQFLRFYMAFAEYRGEQFPVLVKKYEELKAYLNEITSSTSNEAGREFLLLTEVVKFFRVHKKQIRKHDETMFTNPTYPLLVEMESAAIWASLPRPADKEQFWSWLEEIRNLSLAANICTGETAGFELIAKDVIPTIWNSIRREEHNNNSGEDNKGGGMMKRFMEAIRQPHRIRSLRQLIENFGKDPTQVTKAFELITAMLDDDDDDEDDQGADSQPQNDNETTSGGSKPPQREPL